MIVAAIDDSSMPDRDSLLAAMREDFREEAVVLVQKGGADDSAAYRLNIRPQDSTPFTVSELKDGSLTIDGTAQQNAWLAARVRGLLPADYPRMVAIETNGGLYVDLPAGITPMQIQAGWRRISEGDF